MSAGSVLIALISFFILVIWVFSLSVLRGLSILMIISKNQLFVSTKFLYWFLFSYFIQFCSINFCILLEFMLFSLNFLELRLIWNLSLFLMRISYQYCFRCVPQILIHFYFHSVQHIYIFLFKFPLRPESMDHVEVCLVSKCLEFFLWYLLMISNWFHCIIFSDQYF